MQNGVAKQTFYPQAALMQKLPVRATDQKRDIGATLRRASAATASNGTGTQHQVPDGSQLGSSPTSWHGPDFLEARIIGEFNPHSTRFAHNEMNFGALSRELRRELGIDAGPLRDALIERVQSGSVRNRQREMMQTYVGTPIERNCAAGRSYLPKRHDSPVVRDENRGIVRPLTDHAPSEAIAEEFARAIKVADA